MGRLDVGQMLRELTAKQFRDWEVYAALEPFDEKRSDFRAAQIVQMLYNVNRGKNVKAITLEECLLQFELPERPQNQSRSDKIAVIRTIVQAFNAGQQDPESQE